MNNVIGIVCARKDSKRLLNKNILPIKSTTLVENALKTLEDAGCGYVLLVTDIEGIEYKNIMKRPKFVSLDSTPLQTTIKWALWKLNMDGFAYVCILMPTNPMITAEDVKRSYKMITDSDLNIVRSYGNDGQENGMILCRLDYLLEHFIDVYTGSIKTKGIEIHTESDYEAMKKLAEKNKYITINKGE